MKCNEPMFRPGETYSSRDCQLDLGHHGPHEYFRETMPRPEPSGAIDPRVLALLDQSARERGISWSVDERRHTIAFEVTTVYAVEVAAETEDAALQMYEDLADLPHFETEGVSINGSVDVRRLDPYERSDMTGVSPIGPQIACPGCGVLSMRREWYHRPLRRCHGPIRWRETRSPSLRYRWSREHAATPVHAPTGGAL